MNRFTILTATYNKPRFLQDAARCVFAQTVIDWEWWIVLDGPTPDTDAVAASLGRVPGVTVFSEPTSDLERSQCYRPAAIFDQFMPRAETPYLCWLSDDDLWEPDFLERLVAPMESDPAVNITCGGIRLSLQKGDEFSQIREIHAFGKTQDELQRSMGSDSTLFRRSAYHAAGLPRASSADVAHRTEKIVLSALAPVTPVSGIVMTHRVTELSHHRDLFLLKQKRRSRRERRGKRLQSRR